MPADRVLTREKIIEIAHALPPAPQVFADLDRLLRDLNADLHLITELFKKDSTLAAHIIRVSNSVAYRSEHRYGSIEEAIGRVGFKEVFRIVGVVATQRLVDRPLKYYGVRAEFLRDNMVRTALMCEAVATECGLDARTAYTAGLMRPIGILVLDRLAELLQLSETYDHERDGHYPAWEGRHFGLSGCEVGGLILGEWTFPHNIIAAVRKQYLTREEDYEDRLACLLNLACGMIAADGHFIIGEKRHWEITFLKVASLGLEMEQLKKIEERARKAFAAYRKTTGFAPDEAEDTPPVPSTAPQPSSTSVQSAHASQAAKPANPARPAKRQWWRESYAQWPLAVRCTFLFASAGLAQVTFTTAAWLLAGFDSPQFLRTFPTPIAC